MRAIACATRRRQCFGLFGAVIGLGAQPQARAAEIGLRDVRQRRAAARLGALELAHQLRAEAVAGELEPLAPPALEQPLAVFVDARLPCSPAPARAAARAAALRR